ncbi:MAG: TIGR02680 family protein [Kineosporiaceae bacterium]
MTSSTPPRWRPSRAGILNVYQYEDETLHFAGGRLLLRGVNGSGKSTAMNMLLPFLLEADTRRIDAAGRQTGVLKSWMLADSDETQRTGYLWIEFRRPDTDAPGGFRHHTVGCGIRASRSTDRAVTWWFSTPRRARIDFSLTVDRVPLSVDALRAELGAEAVFTAVADYRAEVARRFFGGSDPSSYFRLLHQVRNPRVGDQIDADLPRRLQEALPPVPEDAVADAAQPLEDLEDHRRNVVALTQTDRALGSVLDTYRQYARRILRTAADRTAAAVTAARSASQRRGRLRTEADEAEGVERRLGTEVEDLDGRHAAADAELAGLLTSEAYRDVTALLARRQHVAGLEAHADSRDEERRRDEGRLARSAEAVGGRRARVDGDLGSIGDALVAVTRQARAAGVVLSLPDPPALSVRKLADGVEGPVPDADPLAALVFSGPTDGVRARRQDVARVQELLRGHERAALAAERARDEAERADRRAEEARREAAEARSVVTAADDDHHAAVADWGRRLARTADTVPAAQPAGAAGWLPVPSIPDVGGDEPRAMARARTEAARAAAYSLEQAVEPFLAAAERRLDLAGVETERLAADLATVTAVADLPLPRGAWQHGEPDDADLFASLVDFAPHLDDHDRSGLEAACEAVGLLTASVRDDGTVVAATGDLLLGPGSVADPNLADMLVAAGPEETDAVVTRALRGIGLGARSAAPVWVSPDGRFGAGPLTGRHEKATAEHIGVGARAAARRRRIEELTAALAAAEQTRAAEAGVRDDLVRWRNALRALVRDLPDTRAVDDAAAAATGAVRDARRAAESADGARNEATEAATRADMAWAAAQNAAAESRLPVDAHDLADVDAALRETAELLRRVPEQVSVARRSLRDWTDAAADWLDCAADLDRSTVAAREARSTASRARAELTAAEAALGEDPERLVAQAQEMTARRDGLAAELEARRAARDEAVRLAAQARAVADGADTDVAHAERACSGSRESLRAVLAVSGLLAAARDVERDEAQVESPGDGEGLPVVPDTVDGTATLVAALRRTVPEPVRTVDEDALDRSLRQIRDALGAGWDAGSRRSGDGAPVAVEVSGPRGRHPLLDATSYVADDLRRARGLLSAHQDQALRNLLHGRVARDVARALFEADELIDGMNRNLREVTTSQGIGVRLDWRVRSDLDPATATALRLLAKDPEARSESEDAAVREAVAGLVEDARADDPEASYRAVIAGVLDYRRWHELRIYVRRPGRSDELLRSSTHLSEGEKKLVTYLPMAAAASAAASAVDPRGVGSPRLVMLDDAFAKVSEDNHERLFGLLVGLDLDFVITSERLFGTHASVPELAITEVLRDADLRTIALLHYHWDGRRRTEPATT